MWFSYDTGQILVVVFCCLVIIGLTIWLFTDVSKSVKNIGMKKGKKSVSFGENEVREYETD
jgi:hypothetical protein